MSLPTSTAIFNNKGSNEMMRAEKIFQKYMQNNASTSRTECDVFSHSFDAKM